MSEMLGALIDEGQREFEEGLAAMCADFAGRSHHNAYLGVLKGLIDEEGLDRGQVCSLLAFASVLLVEARAERDYLRAEIEDEESDCRRYRIAWRQARERAQNHLAALVEADAERHYLRGRLRERDDEVAQLVAENADFKGLVR